MDNLCQAAEIERARRRCGNCKWFGALLPPVEFRACLNWDSIPENRLTRLRTGQEKPCHVWTPRQEKPR